MILFVSNDVAIHQLSCFMEHSLDKIKELYTGTPNSDIRKLCYCTLWEECKPVPPQKLKGKG